MNILLLYPEMPDNVGRLKHVVRLAGKKAAFPPLGLLTVAAMLPEDWELKLIDLNVIGLRERTLDWADYVFVSAMTVQHESAAYVIERSRRAGKRVVAGGPLFIHDQKSFPGVTHFVLNEAECTLPPFLEDLIKGSPKPLYRTDAFADIQDTPLPRWDLVNLDDYMYATVQYSRGCPHACEFCDVTGIFGRVPRMKKADRILRELDRIVEAGTPEMIFFADDNLIGNRRALTTDLLPAVTAWRGRHRYAPAFSTQLTISLADDPVLAQALLESGFRHVLIGIETTDENALREMGKMQNTGRDMADAVRRLHQAGFIIIGTFIVGLDTDGPESFSRLASFIQENGIVLAVANMIKAPPGTRPYDRMQKDGRLLDGFGFNEEQTNIIPRMGREQLYRGFFRLQKDIALPRSVYDRTIRFFQVMGRARVRYPLQRALKPGTVLIFLRMLFVLGFIFDGRRYFWKLLVWTIRHCPSYLDLSLLFSAIMYEYHMMNIRRTSVGR